MRNVRSLTLVKFGYVLGNFRTLTKLVLMQCRQAFGAMLPNPVKHAAMVVFSEQGSGIDASILWRALRHGHGRSGTALF